MPLLPGPVQLSAIASTETEQPVDAARRLARLAAEQAPQTEQARRLGPEFVGALRESGLCRLCVPAEIGGLEAPPAVLVQCVEALARGDGSAGWCLAISATSGLLAGYLPDESAREIYGPAQSVVGGVFAPHGRAVPAVDGFRVSGRWPFASGCEHCDWLMGGCIVENAPALPSGAPDVRLMLAPAAEVWIHDTWRVSGLRGTGSHDIEFDGLTIPAGRSASVFTDRPVQNGPLYAFPLFGLLALAIAAVSLGIARAALDELRALAEAKTPTGSRRRLAARGTVQADLARSEAALQAARALVLDASTRSWDTAVQLGEVGIAERIALRLASTHAASTAAEIAEIAYRNGGGSAIYETSPLQRQFRDANAVTQHMLVAPATWELTGRLLLGIDTDTAQL